MEIKVQILRVELANSRKGGRYDLHCKVETQSDEFVNSSIVELAAEGPRPVSTSTIESIPSAQWPTFTYNFREQHTEAVLLFTLSTLGSPVGSGGPLEIARGVVLHQFQSSTLVQERVVILGSMVEGVLVMKYEGRVLFQINCSYSSPPADYAPVPHQWSEMRVPRSHLPLLYSHPLIDGFQAEGHTSDEVSLTNAPREEELQDPEEDAWAVRPQSSLKITAQEVMLQEQQDSAPTATHFPGDAPIVTIFFHAINLPTKALGNQLNLQPLACFTVDKENTVSGGPSCKWGEGRFGILHNSFSYVSIMKSVSLTPNETHSSVGLYLFSAGMEDPLLSAYEDTRALAPFCFHHRIWPYGVESPVTSIDQFLLSSPYVISSACLIPSRADYIRYEGLEVAVSRVTLQPGAHRDAVIGARIASNQLQGLQEDTLHHPPFINFQMNGRAQASNNYKLALLESSTELAAATRKSYFLFTGTSVDPQSLQEADLSLNLQFFMADPTSSAPWWKGHSHRSVQLPLNQAIFSALLGDDSKRGVLWQLAFEEPDFQVDLILRWKMKQMEFMTDLEDSSTHQLPLLENLLHPTSPSPSAAYLQTSLSQDKQGELARAPQQGQEQGLSQPSSLVPDSQVLLSHYKAAIQELSRELTRLREANSQLQQENHALLQQLTQLRTYQAKAAVDSGLRKQLEAMPKVDLVNMIEQLQAKLDHETAEKRFHQEKVHSLQNVLIQKNDMETKFLSLQEAHTGQQKLVHELQRKVKKYRKCYDAWVQQDATISQLEEALMAKAQEPNTAQLQIEYPRDQPTEDDSQSEEDQETIQALELRLVNALQRIAQLEALQATVAFPHQYPIRARQVTAVEQSAANELQLQQELVEAKARMTKLKQENKQLRTNLARTKEALDQSNARPHQDPINRQPPPVHLATENNIRQIQANAMSF